MPAAASCLRFAPTPDRLPPGTLMASLRNDRPPSAESSLRLLDAALLDTTKAGRPGGDIERKLHHTIAEALSSVRLRDILGIVRHTQC